MSGRVSIIMPVYNTDSKYMTASIKSVIKQSYQNWELIIVDDGSNEECANKCEKFKRKDKRIRVIHIANNGVANARNIGTKEAIGDYIMYIDSDDIIAHSLLDEAMKVIRKTDADFVIGGIQHINKYSEFLASTKTNMEINRYENKDLDIVRHAFMTQTYSNFNHIEGIGTINRGPYARLIKSKIAKCVPFNTSLVIGEDVEWNMRLLNECHSVCFVKKNWYGYLVYSTSSLRKYYGNRAALLENYHKELYQNNRKYFDKHPKDYAHNMSVSFYSMLIFEYLSPKSPLNMRQKNLEVKALLNQNPWNFMRRDDMKKGIPLKNRILLRCCRMGFGLNVLKLWLMISRHSR